MNLLPDLNSFPVLPWSGFKWLLDQGVPIETLIDLTPIATMRGVVAADDRFEETPEGETFIAFQEAEDVVFWRPGSDCMGTWLGRSFALNEGAINNPGTYIFDNPLTVYRSPLDWLRNRCDGCVIIDWSRAWSRLQDAPRISVDEAILFQFRQYVKPPKGPKVFVIAQQRAAA